MRRRGALRTVLVLAAALLGAACGSDRDTPEEALAAFREALREGDGLRLDALHDRESRGHRRQWVREARARIARGDPVTDVLGVLALTPEDLTEGTEEQAAARVLLARSPLVHGADWFLSAEVVEIVPVPPDAARIELRGTDGQRRTLWFLEELEGWSFDQYRSIRPF